MHVVSFPIRTDLVLAAAQLFDLGRGRSIIRAKALNILVPGLTVHRFTHVAVCPLRPQDGVHDWRVDDLDLLTDLGTGVCRHCGSWGLLQSDDGTYVCSTRKENFRNVRPASAKGALDQTPSTRQWLHLNSQSSVIADSFNRAIRALALRISLTSFSKMIEPS